MANPAAFLVRCHKKRNFKPPGDRFFLQCRYRFCNKICIIGIPAKNFYTAKSSFHPLKKQFRRFCTSPTKHKSLRQKFRIRHFICNLACKLFIWQIRPKINSKYFNTICRRKKNHCYTFFNFHLLSIQFKNRFLYKFFMQIKL